eukprot:scaffold241143_cov15-Prasinocladus_malaysianus.AAC.1
MICCVGSEDATAASFPRFRFRPAAIMKVLSSRTCARISTLVVVLVLVWQAVTASRTRTGYGFSPPYFWRQTTRFVPAPLVYGNRYVPWPAPGDADQKRKQPRRNVTVGTRIPYVSLTATSVGTARHPDAVYEYEMLLTNAGTGYRTASS